ncbi:receptor-like serine/threonine-protein kinase NCRK [Phalaenopsis equestris]|uniref:receptor-like serine/threonine-protein kinase NCRK n=1 Tax=Phalaenopsis equestris TaxID=78828 RepID=UPI0009E2BBAB|nr:receptor-like serine/threonine-protein kinase NCRK [Phalaenopsis equestris]XP_020571623.1 receptor-like serine/threonine-protein kinase NCRK [Phalaenopsis equestris]XP_020571624.1 receptor-like serine/threonine-protein kinase NCRK [Phalaenopsis equestris]
MGLHMKVLSICFSGLLCLNFICCERDQNGPDEVKWVCNCAANPLAAFSSNSSYNCSTSCHCIPDDLGLPDGVRWNCSCASVSTPQATESIYRSSCFTSCNCTFGSTETLVAQRPLTRKIVLVAFLVCVVIISIALFALVALHVYRKEKFLHQQQIYSSARDTSFTSSANLISYRSASFLRNQHKADTLFSPFTEFLRRITVIFKGEKQTIPGTIIQFSFFELEQATDRFSDANLIGQGVSSNVFYGKLFDGRIVAIKKLKALSETDEDYDFLTEIEIISRLNHCHVVPLLGYCCEYQSRNYERLFVFEFMSNGNLRECLDVKHGKEPLSWVTRVHVALGVAKGLEYLHEAAAPRILHRDIKSTNILLDDNYKPKITDLGMAKYLMADDLPSCSSSPARMLGTFGYFAPEYAIVGKASLKSDVFSYGVVLLELITGRQPIQKTAKGDESLVIWATARLHDSKLVVTELPDPLLKGNFPEEEMQIMAHLARECLQWDPDSRPTMTEIVQILNTIASEKYRTGSFHENFHMGLHWRSIKSTTASDKSQHCSPAIKEVELAQDTSNGTQEQSSLTELNQENSERVHLNWPFSSKNDQNLRGEKPKNREMVLSAEYMHELVFLASAFQNRESSEEDVDLTEPRFESFL